MFTFISNKYIALAFPRVGEIVVIKLDLKLSVILSVDLRILTFHRVDLT